MSFFFILYGGPSDHLFAYYIGAPRSLSSLTIWGKCPSGQFLLIQYMGPLSDQFHCLLYAPPPQISFFACYRGATSHLGFFSQNIWGPPQVSFSAYYMGSHQISFCAYFLGAPLRLIFFLTIWGPSQINFFSYYIIWGPSDQFLRILYRGPLRSVSSPTIWGSSEISFFAI